jgi:hypothetical protein
MVPAQDYKKKPTITRGHLAAGLVALPKTRLACYRPPINLAAKRQSDS